jgi:hypothetical protein
MMGSLTRPVRCTCEGRGVVWTGSLFGPEPLGVRSCICVEDRIATKRELESLRRRWDVLLSDHAIDEAWDELFGVHTTLTPGPLTAPNEVCPMTKDDLRRAVRAAMVVTMHIESGSTTFLDAVAQARIRDLEHQLDRMQVGRGRLAVIVSNHEPGLLTSLDHDAMGVYEHDGNVSKEQ